MWSKAFAWPALDVKITNNTTQTVFFSEAQFRVADSRPDLRPIPVIRGIVYLTRRIYLPLVNVGWGPMEDCVFRFHLEGEDDATPLTADISWPLDGNGQPERPRKRSSRLSRKPAPTYHKYKVVPSVRDMRSRLTGSARLVPSPRA